MAQINTHPGWRELRRNRRDRRAIHAIAGLGPRAIRDIGLDPDEVYDAAGGWGRLDPLRLLLPR